MARTAAPELVPALPLLGWLERGRPTPLRLGLALALGTLGLRIAAMAAFGDLALPLSGGASAIDLREARIGLVLACLLGYVPAAYGWAVGSLRRSLAALGSLLPAPAGVLDEVAAQAGRIPLPARRRCTLIGVAVALSVPFLVDRDPGLYLDAGYWKPETVMNWLELPVIGWLISCLLRSFWADSRRLSHVADRLERIDLLDARALAPFGRQALRIALLTVILPALPAALIEDRGMAPLIAGLALLTAAIATTAFLLPVQGIHDKLVREKQAELSRIRAALRGDATALEQSALGGWRATAADLLAWEARIAAVREWPFDVPTLARFAAFLLLPLGSWLGGALVEHVLSKLLD